MAADERAPRPAPRTHARDDDPAGREDGAGARPLRVTDDELLLLGELYAVVGYRGVAIAGDPDELEAAIAAGARSLIARGLVRVADGRGGVTLTPTERLAPAVGPLRPPAAGAFITELRAGAARSEVWWFGSEAVTRQRPDGPGVHRFEVLREVEARRVLAAHLRVSDVPAPVQDPVAVSEADRVRVFADVGASGADGDGRDTVGPADLARRHGRAVFMVDLVWQRDDDVVDTDTVTWIDCGAWGCVSAVRVTDDDHAPVYVLSPASSAGCHERVAALIPAEGAA